MNISSPPKFSRRKHYRITAGHHHLDLGVKTRIMGVINVTPDSFSHDGCLLDSKNGTRNAHILAQKHIREGADILDIGGESTRPGSKRISVQEEINRVIPSIRLLTKNIKIPISVDTYKSSVAKRALDVGATIINNIMGTKPEKSLLKMVCNYDACIVLMHIQGAPRTMQQHVSYRNLIPEIIDALRNSIEICLDIGIKSDKIIIDPGIGFGKTVEHNLEILNRLEDFKLLKRPLLIGTSRKSFIGKVLNQEIYDRLLGTVTSVCASILKGAHIVRVHDVKAVKEAVTMTDAIVNEAYESDPALLASV